jgi:hypothetical protein
MPVAVSQSHFAFSEVGARVIRGEQPHQTWHSTEEATRLFMKIRITGGRNE